MKLPRRQVLNLAAGAALLPAASSGAPAQMHQGQPQAGQSVRPLAERLAGYADRLRYDDLDPETIERVKSHLIDTIGCGIAAFDERPVRVCRDIALATAGGPATVIGTNRATTAELAAFANGVAFRYLRSERRLCRTTVRASERQYRGVSRGCAGRAGERGGAHHRDSSCL